MLKRGPSDSHAHEVSGIPNAARTIRHAATVNPLNCLAIIVFSQKRFTALPGGTNKSNTPESIALYTPAPPCSGIATLLARVAHTRCPVPPRSGIASGRRKKEGTGCHDPPHSVMAVSVRLRRRGCRSTPLHARNGGIHSRSHCSSAAPVCAAARCGASQSQTAGLDGQVSFAFLPLRGYTPAHFRARTHPEGLPISF